VQKHISLFGGLVRLYMPHQNLGCLGLGIGDRYLGDLWRNNGLDFRNPHPWPVYGIYWRFGEKRYRSVFNSLQFSVR
jgi:hypothetical protein